jgi:hypothetical protein
MLMLAVVLQETMEELPGGTGLWLIGGLLIYAFVAYSFQTIASKTNTPNGWFAWIPILNLVLLLQIAKKPVWWIILLIIPLVNIIIYIVALVGVCQARGKSPWLVLGMFIPLVNLATIGYLAFSD